MKTKALITLLTVGLTLTACGAQPETKVATVSGATASGAASPSAAGDGELAFARCMRGEGIDIKDPTDGRFQVSSDIAEKKKMDAAMAKCGYLLPGGQGDKPSPQDLDSARKQAKCMRENGYPKFPDPDSSGRLKLDVGALGASPDDPKFKAAMEKCRAA
ncbi:hypothetical protein [Nonomuraea sp. NPDC052265]|uniref:hypothetical protein n=1 Tax=Nonomuraea sp. NPDC052265 TaxID=3364374 RepID=UPI0037C9451F